MGDILANDWSGVVEVWARVGYAARKQVWEGVGWDALGLVVVELGGQ